MVVAFCKARNEADAECERTSGDKKKKKNILFLNYFRTFAPMKERNHTFDFLCGICIIRMICLHTITFCGHKDDAWWLEVMGWSFFFMCFFFFKAGYFNKTV